MKAGRILLVQVQGINGDNLSTEDVEVIDINRKGKVTEAWYWKKEIQGIFFTLDVKFFIHFLF